MVTPGGQWVDTITIRGYDYVMSYLSDAHTEWHHANMDRPWDCPLDCGAGEAQMEAEYFASLTDEELAEASAPYMFVGEPDEPVLAESLHDNDSNDHVESFQIFPVECSS